MNEAAANAAPFRASVQLLLKTTPFLVFNLLVYGAFFVATVLWLAVFGGLAALVAARIEILAIIFMMIAVAGPFAVLVFGKRYILYMVKGAHIAVVTKLLLEGELPEGKNQVAYGREVVGANFRDVSVLFVLDRLIDRTVKRFTRRFVRIVDWLPLGGGATQAAKWASSIVNRSLSYVDEAILSYAIARDEENVWQSARHGLILYAQVYQPVLVTALKVWLLGRAFFVLTLLALAIPGILLLLAFNAIWFQIVVFAAVLVMTSLLVRAVFEPFATTYTIVTYHNAIAGVAVDPAWDERLQSVSGEFRKLVGRAREAAGGSRAPGTAGPAGPAGAERGVAGAGAD